MKYIILLTLLLVVLAGCIERYDAKIKGIESILVVEGIITGGTTQITLSKSVGLDVPSALDFITVDNAMVYVACDDGTRSEEAYSSGSGTYLIKTDELRKDAKYCLFVHVNDTVYQSEFISTVTTPPVNVSFTCDEEDIHVCVTAQGRDDQTGYYLWSYMEDWEIHSTIYGQYVSIYFDMNYLDIEYVQRQVAELTSAGWVVVEIGRNERGTFTGCVRVVNNILTPNNKYYCWVNDGSKTFITGATDKLTDNDIRERKINSFPRTDYRTSVLYRVQVLQTGIHKEAYDYYNNVLKNMEQTGSIFAPIPAEITGNIKCISNPKIPVIGYVDVSTATTKDMQYLDDKYFDPKRRRERIVFCQSEIVVPNASPHYNPCGAWIRYNDSNAPPFIPFVVYQTCVDCTKMGGTKIKPENWPNDNL